MIHHLGQNIPEDDEATWKFLAGGRYLHGIFQLETQAAGFALKKINPKNMEDLALVNALNRPGTGKFLNDISDIRKGTKKPEYITSELKPIFGSTYGKMVYQEQLMKCAQILAGFSAKDSNYLLKAIGKKKMDVMLSLKNTFIEGMAKNGFKKADAEKLFSWFTDFANYSFNKCIHGDSLVETSGGMLPIRDVSVGTYIRAFNVGTKEDALVKVVDVQRSRRLLHKTTWSDGKVTKSSLEHKYLCEDYEMRTLFEIISSNLRLSNGAVFQRLESLGQLPSWDLEVEGKYHNFYADGVVVSNSHAVGYSILGYISAYIKLHHPLQFLCSLLNYAQYEQSPQDQIFQILSESRHFNAKVMPPSVTNITNKFTIHDGAIYYPIGLLRSVGEAIYTQLATISATQRSSLDAFLEAVSNLSINKRAIESIIMSGALDKFASRAQVLLYYWFINSLDTEILNKFWTFKSGQPLSLEVIKKFVQYRVPSTTKAGKPRFQSYFKTEISRAKAEKFVEACEQKIQAFVKEEHLTNFFWEMKSMGYSYNTDFGESVKTYCELDSITEESLTYGFVEEIIFRTSKKGNLYAILRSKFDESRSFMIFGETAEGAKDKIKEGDFVGMHVNPDGEALVVSRINVLNNIRDEANIWRT